MNDFQTFDRTSGNHKRSNPSGDDGLPPSKHPRTQERAGGSTGPLITDRQRESQHNTSHGSRDNQESQYLQVAWSGFVGTRGLNRLFQERGSLSEREKYVGFIDGELGRLRELFANSVKAGLQGLLMTTDGPADPVEGAVVEDLPAIVRRVRASRQERSGQEYIPACSKDRLATTTVESLETLEEALPTKFDFGPVKYARSQKIQGKGGHGHVAGKFEVVKGQGNRPYAGHRGGDFVFRYAGKTGIDRDDYRRFVFAGQVARTAGEYEYRLDCVKEDVRRVVIAVLNFRLHWEARRSGRPRSHSDLPEDTPVAELLRFHRVNRDWAPGLREVESAFKAEVADWLFESNVACEFGWLMEKRRRTGWRRIPADIAGLEKMLVEMAMMQTDAMASVYRAKQERIALDMLMEERAAGNEVVVCLHNVHQELFLEPNDQNPPSDPFRNICTFPDISALVETALSAREEKIVREDPLALLEHRTESAWESYLPAPTDQWTESAPEDTESTLENPLYLPDLGDQWEEIYPDIPFLEAPAAQLAGPPREDSHLPAPDEHEPDLTPESPLPHLPDQDLADRDLFETFLNL